MHQKSGKPSQKRRAILQGSLAAPVVLTVSSVGAQTALTSVARKLEGVKNYQPAKSQYFKESPDEWLRRSVPVVQLKYKPQGGSDSADVKDEWFYLDPIKNRYIKLSSMEWMTFGSLLPNDWEHTKKSDTRYLLVWVDPKTGEQSLRAQAEPTGGQIAATCSILSFTCSTGVG